MLLLGRSRQLPFATLPPLRFESFSNFARNRTEHLAQSYERQRLFAGRIRTGQYAGWDWAPILLSSQLDDSEFGTLLNLADQILKSWSQHGEVEYYAFAYPKPRTYPFDSVSASDYFAKKFLTTSLLFNWNTEGLTTITTVNGRRFLTGDRTGALAVLYRPSNSLLMALGIAGFDQFKMQEEADLRSRHAREYFATQGDPLLVRVVQNVLLYQAIQTFLVVNDPKALASDSRSDHVARALEKRAATWLAEIERGDTAIDRDIRTTLSRFMTTSGFSTEKMARVLASPQSVEKDYQGALQRVRSSVRETESIKTHLIEALKTRDKLFYSTCASVGGRIQKDAVGGEQCKGQGKLGETGKEVFTSYDEFTEGVKKMRADHDAMEASFLIQLRDLRSLHETYAKALDLTEKLSKFGARVDLDDVLRDVLESSLSTTSKSSIRTPSVVLSKNGTAVEAIGGHNIDLIPAKRLVAPRIPSSIREAERGKVVVGAQLPPPRAETEALQVRRKGSLLDEMRSIAQQTDAAPERLAEVQAKAKGCACDAVIVQGENGVVYFSRNTPPPAQYTIFGKTGIIDAIAGPPAVKVIRFENFPEKVVENVARTSALAAAGRPLEGTFAGLFKATESDARRVGVSIERAGKEPEVLQLSEEAGAITSLKQTIFWRGSTLEKATSAKWATAFGNETRLDAETSDALIVRLGGTPGNESGLLGVRILMEPTLREGSLDRLLAMISRWIGLQQVKPSPWAESLIELRETIRKQLKPQEVDFYYKHNKGKVRAADLGTRKKFIEQNFSS